MFEKVKKREIRTLLGTTAKMGARTIIHNKLIALYDLDVPWRPSDVEHTQVVNYKNVTNRLSQ